MRRFCPRFAATLRAESLCEETAKGTLSSESRVLLTGERMFKATTAPPPSHIGPPLLVSRCTVRSASSLPVATMPEGMFFFIRRAKSTMG